MINFNLVLDKSSDLMPKHEATSFFKGGIYDEQPPYELGGGLALSKVGGFIPQ